MYAKFLRQTLPILGGVILLCSFWGEKRPHRMPYRQAGLTEKQAAAHLLSRFTYGAIPGQVDEVARMGLEKWFEQQLKADLPEDSLEVQLAPFDALKLSNEQIARTYPKNGQVIRMAVR